MADNVSSLDIAIEQVDNTFKKTDDLRDGLINKLKHTIDTLLISPDDDSPLKLDAKLHIVQTLQALIKDKEAGAVTLAKVKMQKKDTESSDAARQMAIELLKSINVKTAAPTVGKTIIPSNIESSVEAAIALTKHEVDDDELVGNDITIDETK